MHCCDSHLHCCVRRRLTTTGAALSHPHLRADPPSEQQVHSKVSLRRAVDAVQRCGVGCVRADHQGLEKRHDAQAACEPGGGGSGGVPVQPPRLPTYRTSPAQALLTILTETLLAQRLTCSRTATVVYVMSSVH
jgi:hypothetical protein